MTVSSTSAGVHEAWLPDSSHCPNPTATRFDKRIAGHWLTALTDRLLDSSIPDDRQFISTTTDSSTSLPNLRIQSSSPLRSSSSNILLSLNLLRSIEVHSLSAVHGDSSALKIIFLRLASLDVQRHRKANAGNRMLQSAAVARAAAEIQLRH